MQDDVEYMPDVLPADKEGLYCFINDTRLCTASCMAYLTFPKTPGPELNDVQACCALLTNAERVGRHLTIIASMLAATEKKGRTAAADQLRAQAVLAPNPLLPTFPKKAP